MGEDQTMMEQGCARLLVVDDEESVAITVSEVLRRDGFAVDTAMSGEEAISWLQQFEYDLVLTDLHMEGMDGISVLAEVRRIAPLTISIVLTGFASLESAIAALRQGAYDYLIKPCNIDDMKMTIQRGIDHRRLIIAERQARSELELLNRELEQRVEERTLELQQLNKELAEANRSKDIFFATLSHELRTPLTPILGWAKLLKSGKVDAALITQGLDAIERNARLQTRLIDDLLDVSRVISGKLHIELEPTDLGATVEAAVETVREKAATQGVELKVKMPEAPLVVTGSPVRLQQITWNFLSNAIKFTEMGGSVSVEIKASEGVAQVIVCDTGIGIVPELLPHIFDPFYQVDGSLTRRHGGLGLGLAIVQKLAELHGGRVWAESDGPGQGARFVFALPYTAAADSAIEGETRSLVFKLPRRVLIVEDSEDTLEMLRVWFEEMGCQVITADSAKKALEEAARAAPDIIISDIGMPDADGYELLKRLRRQPGFEKIPAIALSGFAMEEDRSRSRAAGFNEHLSKPVEIDKLLNVIQKLSF
jgi:signal transduction histidine kinase